VNAKNNQFSWVYGSAGRLSFLDRKPLVYPHYGQAISSRNGPEGLEPLPEVSLVVCRIPPSPIEKLIPNQSALGLTAGIWALQNCMSLIPKTKAVPESGFMILGNFFILNILAERVGFEFSRKRSFNNIERTAGTVRAPEDSGKQC
jgi:hypothetical protein